MPASLSRDSCTSTPHNAWRVQAHDEMIRDFGPIEGEPVDRRFRPVLRVRHDRAPCRVMIRQIVERDGMTANPSRCSAHMLVRGP